MGKERPKPSSHPPVLPNVSPQEIVALLELQKNKGEELLKKNLIQLGDVRSWNLSTQGILTKAFGSNSGYIDSIIHPGDHKPYPAYEPESSLEKQRRKNLHMALTLLKGCMEHLQNYHPDALDSPPPVQKEIQEPGEKTKFAVDLVVVEKKKEPTPEEKKDNQPEVNKKEKIMEKTSIPKVFVITGKDEKKKEAVASFLANLGVEPVIPQEDNGHRNNLVEKLGKNAEVAFAIILLVGDEVGYPKEKPEESRPRANQKVIFELGFLMGRLPQNLVCALYEEGLDLPAEYQGNVFIPFDGGGIWKLLTARAMKMAHVDIDMNRAV
jgi:predicted nucleotide-binding protein